MSFRHASRSLHTTARHRPTSKHAPPSPAQSRNARIPRAFRLDGHLVALPASMSRRSASTAALTTDVTCNASILSDTEPKLVLRVGPRRGLARCTCLGGHRLGQRSITGLILGRRRAVGRSSGRVNSAARWGCPAPAAGSSPPSPGPARTDPPDSVSPSRGSANLVSWSTFITNSGCARGDLNPHVR